MILNFAKENDFKVSETSRLALADAGAGRAARGRADSRVRSASLLRARFFTSHCSCFAAYGSGLSRGVWGGYPDQGVGWAKDSGLSRWFVLWVRMFVNGVLPPRMWW